MATEVLSNLDDVIKHRIAWKWLTTKHIMEAQLEIPGSISEAVEASLKDSKLVIKTARKFGLEKRGWYILKPEEEAGLRLNQYPYKSESFRKMIKSRIKQRKLKSNQSVQALPKRSAEDQDKEVQRAKIPKLRIKSDKLLSIIKPTSPILNADTIQTITELNSNDEDDVAPVSSGPKIKPQKISPPTVSPQMPGSSSIIIQSIQKPMLLSEPNEVVPTTSDQYYASLRTGESSWGFDGTDSNDLRKRSQCRSPAARKAMKPRPSTAKKVREKNEEWADLKKLMAKSKAALLIINEGRAQTIRRHLQTISTQRDTIKRLENEFSAIAHRNSNLIDENAEAVRELEDTRSEVLNAQILARENEEYKRKMSDLQQKLINAEQEHQERQNPELTIEVLKQELKGVRRQLDAQVESNSLLQKAVADHDADRAARATAEAELAKARENLGEQLTHNNFLHGERVRLEAEVRDSQGKLNRIEQVLKADNSSMARR